MKTTIWKSLTISLLILLFFIAVLDDRPSSGEEDEAKKSSLEEPVSLVASQPLEVKVTMEKQYLDGVTEVEEKIETIWAMEDFWANYDGWTLMNQGEGFVEFYKQIDDLSPEVKANGYFGIDLNDQLTIFLGKPTEGKVIESFFPIPVDTLESSRRKELEQGIKIQDKNHFNKVIETYADRDPIDKH
ncbi:BofC C-terminal domain-containing protein [Thalassobacillus devorans]|uniref:BofC C-terminal domain-containing protein n=1 Tax=Thalassobacillus devorans TaxID=279813 RepID=UPI001593469D|nr:BofC C-terminal domain-containing protein [Thalassobacillus devorans]